MKRDTLGLCAALLVVCGLVPRSARAFSDVLEFAKPTNAINNPPEAGGGDGRYFTGSPADGYTCKVCHQGAEGPSLRILGLPLAGYVPGAAYEVTVDWPDNLDHVSLALEITDQNGNAAGSLRTPDPKELPVSEQCLPVGPVPTGAGNVTSVTTPATQTQPMATRKVLQMPDCGARQMRFLWTAPAQDAGPVWLAGAVVRSDGMDTTTGDGVTDIARAIGSPSSGTLVASKVNASCGVAQGRSGRAPSFGLGALAWLAIAWRRRRGAKTKP
jgi:hypothetical protein